LGSEAHNCSDHNAWVKIWIHLGHLHIEGRKMSKSLKNFISINDYLRSNITSSPADDFRIFCLQHKYRSSLTYSEARVVDASKYRIKIEGFGGFVRSVVALAGSGVEDRRVTGGLSRKPTAESVKLTRLLGAVRRDVEAALSSDVDTPRVLNCLSQLAGEGVLYAQLVLAAHNHSSSVAAGTPAATTAAAADNDAHAAKSQTLVQHPLEPLLSVSHYIYKILSMLGLQFPSTQAQLLSQKILATSSSFRYSSPVTPPFDAGVSGDTLTQVLTDDSIDAIVQFRAAVRGAAAGGLKVLVQHSKKIKKERESKSDFNGAESLDVAQIQSNYEQILRSCDSSRAALGTALGIKIDDISGAVSKWERK
jgi:hypothetical protein